MNQNQNLWQQKKCTSCCRLRSLSSCHLCSLSSLPSLCWAACVFFPWLEGLTHALSRAAFWLRPLQAVRRPHLSSGGAASLTPSYSGTAGLTGPLWTQGPGEALWPFGNVRSRITPSHLIVLLCAVESANQSLPSTIKPAITWFCYNMLANWIFALGRLRFHSHGQAALVSHALKGMQCPEYFLP